MKASRYMDVLSGQGVDTVHKKRAMSVRHCCVPVYCGPNSRNPCMYYIYAEPVSVLRMTELFAAHCTGMRTLHNHVGNVEVIS